MRKNKINYNELCEINYYNGYDIIREDLLKLYIYKETCDPQTEFGQKINIKHSTGNIHIKNYENWFTKNLLEDYLNKYLEDIRTVEQAEQELSKPAGRKIKDPRLIIIMYGIYRMFKSTNY